MNSRAIIQLLCWLVIESLTAGAAVRTASTNLVPLLTSRKEVQMALSKRGQTPAFVFAVFRDTNGEKLLISFKDLPSEKQMLAVIDRMGTLTIISPTVSSWIVDDRLEFVCWWKDGALEFRNGAKLKLPMLAQRRHDIGGTLFAVSVPPFETWFASSEKPSEKLLTLDSFFATKLFSSGKSMIVFGEKQPEIKRTRGQYVCRFYEHTSDGFNMSKEFDLSQVGSTIDYDVARGWALMETSSGMFPQLIQYELATGKRVKLGAATEFALFAQEELIRQFRNSEPGVK